MSFLEGGGWLWTCAAVLRGGLVVLLRGGGWVSGPAMPSALPCGGHRRGLCGRWSLHGPPNRGRWREGTVTACWLSGGMGPHPGTGGPPARECLEGAVGAGRLDDRLGRRTAQVRWDLGDRTIAWGPGRTWRDGSRVVGWPPGTWAPMEENPQRKSVGGSGARKGVPEGPCEVKARKGQKGSQPAEGWAERIQGNPAQAGVPEAGLPKGLPKSRPEEGPGRRDANLGEATAAQGVSFGHSPEKLRSCRKGTTRQSPLNPIWIHKCSAGGPLRI